MAEKRDYSVAIETVLGNYSALDSYLTTKYGHNKAMQEFAFVIDAARELDPRERLPIETVSQTMHQIAQHLGEPNMGLRVSQHASPGSLLPFQLIAEGRFEFIEILQMLQRYVAISTEVISSHIINNPEELVLQILPNSPETVSYHQLEGGVGIVIKILEFMNGPKPTAIQFTHSRIEDEPGIHRKTLGLEPEFESEVTAIHFPVNTKHNLLGGGSRDTSMDSIGQLESRRRKLYQEESTTERVKFLLRHLLSLGEPRRQQIATILDMSVRTFQRRLEQEGTTFNDLLRDLRIEMAKQHLEDDVFSCNEIAFLLGYKDTSQFYKSFRNWCDLSPAQYRQNALAN